MPMPEKQVSGSPAGGAAEGPREPSEGETSPREEVPTFICEFCGRDKPVAQVFPCTLCNMNFCVEHLALKHHYCVGALGKPQVM